ncbi:MAG: NAD(P)H-dependent oxidoreductase [Chryseobacterium sp.]|uniref:NAD(P)H-dependent oxidoreductase n=1 Tax=Chryseobacterium sp. TaxID=1871047 RepID=UPI0025BE56C2|nr:NAD(P)H-dependent oxidoreductase [Chryseobacterium sp.]MCJ7932236.1 NAD(P)H-dependent oxidoreductase [Chryseobacterium sp.]
MQILNNLKWRYATKKFDADKKISDKQLSCLKEAVRLSVSSYGLQLYKVLIVSDPEIKKQLQPLCWQQSQIADCSHLFIFCSYKNYNDNDVDDYIKLVTTEQGLEYVTLEGYGAFIKGKVSEKTAMEQTAWLERQPYLAVSNLIMACAEQQIDTCPMEGFTTEDINRFFHLNSKNLNAVVMVAVGYRSKDDIAQYRKKVRKTEADLFEIVGG